MVICTKNRGPNINIIYAGSIVLIPSTDLAALHAQSPG